MITLDAIIPYQPPLPHKPPKSSKIAPPPSKPPPLAHPLPQKPDARDQASLSPFQSCQSLSSFVSIPVDQEQTSRRPSSTNAFDTELAAWSDMAINHTTAMNTTAEDQGEGQEPRNDGDSLVDNSESPSSDFREPEPYEESTQLIQDSQRYGTHDSAASDSKREHAISVTIAHSDDAEALHTNGCASDLQSAEALTLQPDVDVRGSGLESQDIPDDEWESTPSGLPLNMVSSVNGDTGLERQDQNDDHDNLPSCEDDHLTDEPALIHSKEPSPSASVSSERKRTRPRENCAVAVVIPAAQPLQPRKRPYRLRNEAQTYRTDPQDESEEFDDSNDDDYVDRAEHVEHQRHSTKRPKYQPIVRSDPMKPEAVRDFKLGDLSLPNLRTVQRGVLTCEFFPSQIMYSFSWAEDRGCSEDCPPNDDNTLSKGDGRSEMNGIRRWDLDTSSKDVEDEATENIDDNQRNSRLNSRKPGCGGKRRRKKAWTVEEDARLKLLKEKDNLSWSQILKYFPDRKQGTLQFRYYNVLRNSTSKSSVISSHGATDRTNTPPSSPHSDRQQRIDSFSQSATESTLRSRYGPARSCRSVKRYSS
uniref:Transcriptional regulatory protein TOD6 n=1 Tax=Talaromyces marneffei PM1 TaxID=1077442 RepID=A0A093UQM9_TALMA